MTGAWGGAGPWNSGPGHLCVDAYRVSSEPVSGCEQRLPQGEEEEGGDDGREGEHIAPRTPHALQRVGPTRDCMVESHWWEASLRAILGPAWRTGEAVRTT